MTHRDWSFGRPDGKMNRNSDPGLLTWCQEVHHPNHPGLTKLGQCVCRTPEQCSGHSEGASLFNPSKREACHATRLSIQGQHQCQLVRGWHRLRQRPSAGKRSAPICSAKTQLLEPPLFLLQLNEGFKMVWI